MADSGTASVNRASARVSGHVASRRHTNQRERGPSNRRVPGTAFSTGQPSHERSRSGECRYRATHGVRVCDQVLAEGRRPPRSFPGGAVLLPIRAMSPLREMHRAGGASRATPKAGVGTQAGILAVSLRRTREGDPRLEIFPQLVFRRLARRGSRKMWPFRKRLAPTPSQVDRLVAILERCANHTTRSQDSPWSYASAGEMSAKLSTAVERAREDKTIGVFGLKLLFAPTGSLQESSMSNGWANEFLALSSEFDEAIKPWE